MSIPLAPGVEVRCPHCDAWHRVHPAATEGTEETRSMVFFLCRGGRYFAGSLGYPSQFQTRRTDVKYTGLSCPSCRLPAAVIEDESLGTLLFACQACGHRWSTESATRPQ